MDSQGDNANFVSDETRQKFIKEMEHIEDEKAIHPTEVFDMIAGTSVGGLMAFALVGGKEDQKGQRMPMTLQEIVDFMSETTSEIWPSRWKACWNTFRSCTFHCYTNDGLASALQDQFGDSTLHSFKNECIAAAIARKFGCKDPDEQETFDCLEVFDTHPSSKDHKVTDVLKATSNAPVFFNTPITINGVPYVDGGVGGNCPLPQGLRRMKELYKKRPFGTGLSIAPPREFPKGTPRGLIYWMKYFPKRTTDGFGNYVEHKKQHPRGTNQRLYPRSEDAKKFTTSDKRVKEMEDCMVKERADDPAYLQEIFSAALVIASRVKTIDEEKLWKIVKVYEKGKDSKVAQQMDNHLAIMNAMSKIELKRTDALRHEIILTQAQVQFQAGELDEAQETLEKVNMDNDNLDEDIKKQMIELLGQMVKIEENQEGIP